MIILSITEGSALTIIAIAVAVIAILVMIGIAIPIYFNYSEIRKIKEENEKNNKELIAKFNIEIIKTRNESLGHSSFILGIFAMRDKRIEDSRNQLTKALAYYKQTGNSKMIDSCVKNLLKLPIK
ncbi:MAG: hypothetical protein HOO91_17695 [Bacteroidales bacterium]|nr:hypothetical protein [Bacteroidales bacterium]